MKKFHNWNIHLLIQFNDRNILLVFIRRSFQVVSIMHIDFVKYHSFRNKILCDRSILIIIPSLTAKDGHWNK